MRLLLDTHVLIWAADSPEMLSKATRDCLNDLNHTLYFSVASLWEINIKRGLGRSDFRIDPRVLRRGLIDNGYIELPIESPHALLVDSLPPIHKDPFDRILIAQAMAEGLILVSNDQAVLQYPLATMAA